MTETFDKPLAQLHEGEITHQEFLRTVGCEDQYKKWCEEHQVAEDENSATLYFDYYGFEDNSVVKEFIEPLP